MHFVTVMIHDHDLKNKFCSIDHATDNINSDFKSQSLVPNFWQTGLYRTVYFL